MKNNINEPPVDILDFITGGKNMTIHYLDNNATFLERLTEIFWIAIMYIGFPLFSIVEWIRWEIYGHGPKKETPRFR